jgi:uncharacterized protein YndB with AHSA1/START domain
MIDVTEQINSVDRQVGRRTLEAGEARTLTISRVYDTPLEDLWDACTNPERIPRWFLPVSGDLRVAGRFEIEGNASGTIERCEPPNSFHATWEHGGAISWIELRLTPEADGRTRFALDHIAHIDDGIWAQYGPGAVGVGWDGAVMGLTLHLTGAERPEPEALVAWPTSEEGRRFYTLSSERWAEASIAAGADAAEAHAAEARTTAAYTGRDQAAPEQGAA